MTYLDEKLGHSRANEASTLLFATSLSHLAPVDAFAAFFAYDNKESSL
jgi:hypothetical protein